MAVAVKLIQTLPDGIRPLSSHVQVVEQAMPATTGNAAALKRVSSRSGMGPMLAADARAARVKS